MPLKPFSLKITNDVGSYVALASQPGVFTNYTLTFPEDGAQILDGQALTADPSGNLRFDSFPLNPRMFAVYFDDFDYAFYGQTTTQINANTTSSLGARWRIRTNNTASQSTFIQDISASGLLRMFAGTATAGYTNITSYNTANQGQFPTQRGMIEFLSFARIVNFGFASYFGFYDSITDANGTQGEIRIRVNNNGSADLLTRDGTATPTVTSIVGAGTINTVQWYTYKIIVAPDGTSVSGEIWNNAIPSVRLGIGVATTNIPTRDRNIGQCILIDNNTGALNGELWLDYVLYRMEYDRAPR